MWETLGPYFVGAGAAFLLVGCFQLMAAAFRQRLLWGLGTLLLLPAPFFVLEHFRKALPALLVMLLGAGLALTPTVATYLQEYVVDFGPLHYWLEGEWETLGPYFFGAAAAFLLVGFLQLVAAAFRTQLLWGLGTLLLLPAPVFVLRHFRKALPALLVLLLGVGVALTPLAVNHFYRFDVDLGPLETWVDGELHITLTGWQPKDMDYSVLKQRPEVAVLQMANEDVTDQTLDYLKKCTKLRRLDLSNTRITDEGLKVLRPLPHLEALYLNNTAITDAGVRASIFPIATLHELNVRKTEVTKKTRDEWKAAQPERKVVPAF
jgi:hypothetical protein